MGNTLETASTRHSEITPPTAGHGTTRSTGAFTCSLSPSRMLTSATTAIAPPSRAPDRDHERRLGRHEARHLTAGRAGEAEYRVVAPPDHHRDQQRIRDRDRPVAGGHPHEQQGEDPDQALEARDRAQIMIVAYETGLVRAANPQR
jgi:hypothetical protein